MRYEYPGNVRELENIIERAVVLEDESMIQPERLPFGGSAATDPAHAVAVSGTPTLEAVEEAYIRRIFAQTGAKKSETCRILGISRPTLDRKLERYQIVSGGRDEDQATEV
jgi:transcriptional regulator with PAS, ATPase and Fis domain